VKKLIFWERQKTMKTLAEPHQKPNGLQLGLNFYWDLYKESL
jgi:hypothetical protein